MFKRILYAHMLMCLSLNLNAMHQRDRRHTTKTQQKRAKLELFRQGEINDLVEQRAQVREYILDLEDQNNVQKCCLAIPFVLCCCYGVCAVPNFLSEVHNGTAELSVGQALIRTSECFCCAFLIPRVWCAEHIRERQAAIEQARECIVKLNDEIKVRATK